MPEIFNSSNLYQLENERVLLRPLQAEDHKHLLPFALQEPGLWKYALQTAAGSDGLTNYLSAALLARKTGKEYPFIVWDKKANAYAGCTRFYDINLHFQTVQLGYTWYGERFQGTGLNKHCKFLLLQFAFEQLGMLRVEFRADQNNAKSIAAMRSIGCTEEGILRSNMPTPKGGRRNSIVFSILAEEWVGHIKQSLLQKLTN